MQIINKIKYESLKKLNKIKKNNNEVLHQNILVLLHRKIYLLT